MFQVAAIGCFLIVMIPAGCAIFPQMCAIETEKLKIVEPSAYEEIMAKYKTESDMPKTLYFNKGL